MAASTSSPAALRVAPLDSAHVHDAARVLHTAFATGEYAWGPAVGMPPQGFEGWMLHDYIPKRVAAKPASLIALSATEVAGVMAMEDYHEAEEPLDTEASGSGMSAIMELLHRCKGIVQRRATNDAAAGGAAEAALLAPSGDVGQALYFAFLGVSDAHRRHGVAARLVDDAVTRGRAEGFAAGVAFCTSHASTALFKRAGFEHWGGVRYHEFEFEGRKPFASLPDDECTVMVARWKRSKQS